MDKKYILSSIFATMSCTTVAISNTVQIEGYELVCPEQSVEIPLSQNPYLFSLQSPSYIPPSNRDVMNDFEVLVSFANKVLTNEVPIDEEIQHVIEDHFWDML